MSFLWKEGDCQCLKKVPEDPNAWHHLLPWVWQNDPRHLLQNFNKSSPNKSIFIIHFPACVSTPLRGLPVFKHISSHRIVGSSGTHRPPLGLWRALEDPGHWNTTSAALEDVKPFWLFKDSSLNLTNTPCLCSFPAFYHIPHYFLLSLFNLASPSELNPLSPFILFPVCTLCAFYSSVFLFLFSESFAFTVSWTLPFSLHLFAL